MLPKYDKHQTMTLGQKQRKFTLMVSYLIQHAYQLGYELTFGDAYRDPRVFGPVGERPIIVFGWDDDINRNGRNYSHHSSNHKQRLAIDFNVFRHGEYLDDGAEFKDLGEYWESLGGTWGGRFNDGGHFSLEHNGVK